MQGKTGAWDLSSLVVKPVQRVLKYPLLIKSLLKETPEDDPDYNNLVQAMQDIERVAEKINEVKKRVDIVEKYVEGKGHLNVMHGITKKLSRGTQHLKKVTGLTDDSTSDQNYNQLSERFTKLSECLVQFQKEVFVWLRTIKDRFEAEDTFSNCLEDVYFMEYYANQSRTHPLVKQYRIACSKFRLGLFSEVEMKCKTVISPSIDKLLMRFKEPQLVMKKRDAKLLDYERAQEIRAKGEQVDKVLAESADAYTSINAQLIEELPQFFSLVSNWANQVLLVLIKVQMEVHEHILKHILPLEKALSLGMDHSVQQIVSSFEEQFSVVGCPLEVQTRSISLMEHWRDDVWGTGRTDSTSLPRYRSESDAPSELSPSQPSPLIGTKFGIHFNN